jgi:hypothetical protein
MQTPDPVETILARLMPPALSEGGHRSIESMLDELAADVPAVKPVSTPRPHRACWLGGIAAAGVAAAWLLPLVVRPASGPVATAPREPAANVMLVGQSGRIESMTDEGWHEEADGSAMQALRLNVVEEESVLDRETGIIMQIREPREEILLMPVSSF